MSDSQEIELKLLVRPEDLPRLWRHPRVRELTLGSSSVGALDSVYYDTPELDLARDGLVLRLRRGGPSTIQTIKTRNTGSAGLFQRGEWETPVSSDKPDLTQVHDPALRVRLASALSGKSLAPILRTLVRRSRRRVGNADWEAHFDLDVGEVTTVKGSHPICELELELVRGDPGALYDLALDLHESIALRPASIGKAEQGLAALLGETPAPRRARRLDLAPDATFETALAEIVAGCIGQIVSNETPARSGHDPEGVHQMRVGVRRLRSALSLFGDAIPEAEREAFRSELSWLGGELGDARDLDVFLLETLDPILEQLPDRAGFEPLRVSACRLREIAYARARAAVDSRRYTRLLLALGAWSSGRRWRSQALTPQSARLFAPARDLGAELLSHRFRKVRRRGRGIRDLSVEECHRLRIQLKKLRYASEFLSSLYPHRHAWRFIRRASRLQDTLGHLNDQSTADRLVARILEMAASDSAEEQQRAAGYVSGWTARVTLEKLQPLERQWKRFAKLDAFWRARA